MRLDPKGIEAAFAAIPADVDIEGDEMEAAILAYCRAAGVVMVPEYVAEVALDAIKERLVRPMNKEALDWVQEQLAQMEKT